MSRLNRIEPSGIRKVFNRAQQLERQGKEIFHFEIGRPDLVSPAVACEGVTESLAAGQVHYTANKGILALREVLLEQIHSQYHVQYSPEEIIITAGSSEGLSACLCALLEAGDEVIIPTPAWNHYKNCTLMFDGVPVEVPLDPEAGFALCFEKLRAAITDKTKIIILNTPNNPTGAVYSKEVLESVVQLCEEKGILVLADEVYDCFVYDGTEHISLLQLFKDRDLLVYLNSFSKRFSMTGWRLGYLLAPNTLAERINMAHQYLVVCANSFAQQGALKLLLSDTYKSALADMKNEFQKRWALTQSILSKINCIQLTPTAGAMYFFPVLNFRKMNDLELSSYLLEEGGIATVPGSVFGSHFTSSLRLAYTVDRDTLERGLNRLKELMNNA